MEIIQVYNVIKDIGIPAAGVGVSIWFIYKLIPELLTSIKAVCKSKIDRDTAQVNDINTFYESRNKIFTEQLSIMNHNADEQRKLLIDATAIIDRSNEVVKANTEAMSRNNELMQKMISILTNNQRDTEALRDELAKIKYKIGA